MGDHAEIKGFWANCRFYLTTTNHKDIGSLYLWFALAMFLIAGVMALFIRAELSNPGRIFMEPDFYNQMVTMHGLVMIFGAIMPALAGFANWQIPMMIGAADMAFPRMNNWSFWILPFAFFMLLGSKLFTGGWPNFGWTFYAPLSSTYGPPSTDFMILSIHMMGISSILASINIVATIMTMRAPWMQYMRMPIFVWSWFVTALLLIAIMPVLAVTVTMLLFDRHFGTSFFNAAGGGDPVLFQHLFWFFGHPEVYVLVMPAFGIISEVIPTFARKALYGAKFMIYAIACIAILSFIVWVHHMFTSGVMAWVKIFFMITTMIVAVPTGIKVFNWVGTMYRGAISFEPPMLFAISFIVLFTIGGFTGLMLGVAAADIQYQDTYFVVAHFHHVIVSGVYFSIVTGVYYWLPKWSGRMYSFKMANWHFWLSVVSVNLTFFPMYFLGLVGMPRRIPDYNVQFTDMNLIATVGAFVFGIAQLIFVWILIDNIFLKRGQRATAKVWDNPLGLEWEVDSPAPHHTFMTPPPEPKDAP